MVAESGVSEVLRYRQWMERGFLPCRGGVMDQSATFLRAVEVVDWARARFEEDRRRRAAKKGRRPRG